MLPRAPSLLPSKRPCSLSATKMVIELGHIQNTLREREGLESGDDAAPALTALKKSTNRRTRETVKQLTLGPLMGRMANRGKRDLHWELRGCRCGCGRRMGFLCRSLTETRNAPSDGGDRSLRGSTRTKSSEAMQFFWARVLSTGFTLVKNLILPK